MSEEEIREAQEYNLEYMEAMSSEEIFGGDYTSAVELKYANKTIERLQQVNKQLKDRIDKAIEIIESYNLGKYDYSVPPGGIIDLLDLLRGTNEEVSN